MSIDFPASPTPGQAFASGSTSWTWDGTKWAATSSGGGGAGGATHTGYISGRYYTRATTVPTSSAAVVANRIYLTPIWIASAITINGAQVSVSTAAASNSGEVGIYNNGAAGLPTTLLRDIGTFSLVGTGQKTLTGFTQALTAGWYWLAVAVGLGCDMIQSGTNDTALGPFLGTLGLINLAPFDQYAYVAWTFAAGALPATLAPGSGFTVQTTTGQAPILMLRIA